MFCHWSSTRAPERFARYPHSIRHKRIVVPHAAGNYAGGKHVNQGYVVDLILAHLQHVCNVCVTSSDFLLAIYLAMFSIWTSNISKKAVSCFWPNRWYNLPQKRKRIDLMQLLRWLPRVSFIFLRVSYHKFKFVSIADTLQYLRTMPHTESGWK